MRFTEIEALRKSGMPWAAIAERFGVSRQRIEQVFRANKSRARHTLNVAVQSNRIYKPDHCFGCLSFAPLLHGHHDDYSKPLNVRWLCPLCHARAHPRTNGVRALAEATA